MPPKKVPQKVRDESLAKWEEPVGPSELYVWWQHTGGKSCAFCCYFANLYGSSFYTCKVCPLKANNKGPCMPEWAALLKHFDSCRYRYNPVYVAKMRAKIADHIRRVLTEEEGN